MTGMSGTLILFVFILLVVASSFLYFVIFRPIREKQKEQETKRPSQDTRL
jgi:preprotein translocase subunit YajC